MDEPQVAAAVAAFFNDPALDLGLSETYPYPLSNTTGDLPDVVVFVEDVDDATVPPAERFPGQDIQEAWWRVFQVTCSFMVAVEQQSESGARAAWTAIEGMVAAIRQGVGEDLTLGGRLDGDTICSPMLHFDFSEPFIAREDQTRGRAFRLEMVIAERIAAPESFWPSS